MRAAGIALVPTLKLWRYEFHHKPAVLERFERAAIAQVRDFAAAGGPLLFGTDVGYVHDHDPTEEYALLATAGLSYRDVLRMLTTGPAARFGRGGHATLAAGEEADIVVLEADPRGDPIAWSRVRLAMRGGALLHGAF
jgi:imidazolonepropionase-like amidohydrolase